MFTIFVEDSVLCRFPLSMRGAAGQFVMRLQDVGLRAWMAWGE